ncbi:MAG TPA: hypothetical protein VD838_07750 [Anaeromyxobacteraceae bacterium]|nr:hypothetical protein [Anaeromyxobacteraceae bacterium]
MSEHDGVKPNRTISHNLEDRLGATLDERLAERERMEEARTPTPRDARRPAPAESAGRPGAADEGP